MIVIGSVNSETDYLKHIKLLSLLKAMAEFDACSMFDAV